MLASLVNMGYITFGVATVQMCRNYVQVILDLVFKFAGIRSRIEKVCRALAGAWIETKNQRNYYHRLNRRALAGAWIETV
jgi:hypothetical protein